MHPLWLVGAGGFMGAAARFAVSRYAARTSRSPMPWGTLFVNLTGAFLLGILAGLDRRGLSLLWGTGFMGAFTTFSTFKVEGIRLWMGKSYRILLLYYGISYTVGIGLAWLGYELGNAWR